MYYFSIQLVILSCQIYGSIGCDINEFQSGRNSFFVVVE